MLNISVGLQFGIRPSAGSQVIAPPPPLPVVSLARAGSLAFPQANNLTPSAPTTVLSQDRTGFPTFWNAPGALFFIARRPIAATYRNASFYLMDGLTNATRQSYILMRGGALGTSADRLKLFGRISAAGVIPQSQPVTEDAFLGVLRRDVASKGVLDWYSLGDGTKHAGTPTASTISQSQLASVTPFTLGGQTARIAGAGTDWPGEIAAIGYVVGDIPDATWQAIALGAPLNAALTVANVPWVRTFDGSVEGLVKPAWATADATGATGVLTGSVTAGSTLRRAAAASYLTVTERSDGYVHGLLPGETSRSVTFSGKSAGRTGFVEARVIYAATGQVLVDWTALGAVSATWSGNLTIPRCAAGWVIAQVRTTDDPTAITHAMRRFAVGYKFLQLGQSQTQIYLGNATRNDAFANPRQASYATSDVANGNPPVQQLTYIGANTSDGLSAFVDQFRAYGDATPIMVIDGAVVGTGPDQLMDDAQTARNWSELQDKLDRWGNDVTAVLMNWATQGWTSGTNTAQHTLEALIYGTGSYIGTVNHTLTAALREGFAFGLSPATRHTIPAVHEANRTGQVDFANSRNLPVGLPVSDFEIEAAGGPHPTGAGLGNRIFGARMAHLAATCIGLTVPVNPSFTTATRAGAVITVNVQRPNGGNLYSPAPTAIRNFQVNEGGGFTSAGFTAALSGNTVVLTRTTGTWAAGTVVTYLVNGEPRPGGDTAAETAIVNGMLYETHPSDILGLGVPVAGSRSGNKWVPGWQAVAT